MGARRITQTVLAIVLAGACTKNPDAARDRYAASGDAYFARKQVGDHVFHG